MERIISSPLQYPGGKRWLFKTLYKYIPRDTQEMISPFFGGGAIELNMAARGVKVYGYDLSKGLNDFWETYLSCPSSLVKSAKYLLSTKDKDYFRDMHRNFFNVKSMRNRGAIYFLLNRMSYGGKCLGSDVGLRKDYKKALSPSILKSISEYNISNVYVECLDFVESLNNHKFIFSYLDPPYPMVGKRLYFASANGFDHAKLSSILNDRPNWILSYSSVPMIEDLYKGYYKIRINRKSSFRYKSKRP